MPPTVLARSGSRRVAFRRSAGARCGLQLTAYYDAMGVAVSIAARMEQAAEAGHVVISPETKRLAGDGLEVRSLGLQG